MNNGRRYSLISTYNGVKTIIRVNEYDEKSKNIVEKDKVLLTTIDLLTSNFLSKEEFNSYFNLPSNAKLSIVYQSNKQEKEIPCIFSDHKLIRYFAGNVILGESKIDIVDKYYRKFLNSFFLLICNTFIRNSIMMDRSINTYIKNKISEYLQSNHDNEFFNLKKLEIELLNYKNLRSVILNINNYEFKNGVKILSLSVPLVESSLPAQNISISRFVPTEDMEEPLFPPNSEEEVMYNNYMDNLPDEYSCHEKDYCLRKKK